MMGRALRCVLSSAGLVSWYRTLFTKGGKRMGTQRPTYCKNHRYAEFRRRYYDAGMRKTIFVRTLSCRIALLLAHGAICLPAFAQNATPAAAPTEAQATATATATAKDAPAAAMPSDPKELMLLAAKSNGLTGDDVKPWHVKATYQLLDGEGNVKDQGTYEEFWVSPTKYKRTFTGAAFTQTDYGTDKGDLRSGSQDQVLYAILVRVKLISPLPDVKAIERERFAAQKQTVGGVKLTCLKMKDEGGNAFGAAWCIDIDQPILRIDAISPGTQNLHNRILRFQGRFIAGDLAFVQEEKTTLTAHIDILEALDTIDEAIFVPPADAAPPKPRRINISGGVTVSGGVMAKLILKKVDPVYPPIAKAAGIQGMVVLQAMIGQDGRVENLRVISGPAMLQQSAIDAVKTWRYSPYQLNGEPVEVQTTVNVIFTLGG